MSRELKNVDELYGVKMKPPRNLQDQSPNNIADLVSDLWALYYAMTSDPALGTSAKHIRKAVLELEKTRRLAWQVFQEEQHALAVQPEPHRRRTKKSRKDEQQEADDWLREVAPASPLKQ